MAGIHAPWCEQWNGKIACTCREPIERLQGEVGELRQQLIAAEAKSADARRAALLEARKAVQDAWNSMPGDDLGDPSYAIEALLATPPETGR